MADLAIAVISSLIPAIIYLIIVRNSEQIEREKWRNILISFGWGAIPAVLISGLFEYLFLPLEIFVLIIAAPVFEELLKPVILLRLKRDINELEDGMIYGASAAIGFACTENIGYFLLAYTSGQISFLVTVILVRTILSYMCHISATGITGYGVAINTVMNRPPKLLTKYLLTAILIHAVYNWSLSLGFIGLGIGTLLAIGCFVMLRKAIKTFDRGQTGTLQDL
jgi:RsiW-degrading membrane proteinase PrsW (M82 family)